MHGKGLYFLKHGGRGLGLAVFPLSDEFCDDLDFATKRILTQAVHAPRFENPLGGGIDGQGVCAKKAHQPRPKTDNGSDLIAFPALVLLANGAQLLGGLGLGEVQEQTFGVKMLPETFGIEIEAFTYEISEPQRRFARPNRKKAKWQNRTILFCLSRGLHEQKLRRVRRDRTEGR